MQLPQSDILTTNRLGNVFNKTVATYKFDTASKVCPEGFICLLNLYS